MTPFAAALGDFDVGGDRVRGVLEVDEGVFVDAHARIEGQRRAPAHQLRPSGELGVEAFDAAVVDRQHVIGDRLVA